MINKYITTIITRIIEFIVIAFSANWIWSLAEVSLALKIIILISVITAYCFYLGVTVSNDYWELTRGEGEPML